MRIDAIDVFHVAMPLISPWRTAYGEDSAIESVLVRMQSGSAFAWGEAAPFAAPCYSPEWAASAFLCVRDWLAPALVGRELESGAQLQQRLAHFKGNPFAKASLDTAWWTLAAKLTGKPVYRALGGQRNAVDAGADFGVLDSIDELLPCIGRAIDEGFQRVKLKFRPGWDIPMLSAVRREFPTAVIHIDCNSGYTLNDLDLFRKLDDFQLAMIEQPLGHDDLLDHARLQASIRTPVCLDESINSVARARQAIELKSCRWVNIKPGRVGGLTNAVAIHDLCRNAGIPCWVGGMLESAIGAQACIALAMLDNFTYPADIFPSSRFYVRDLAQPEVVLSRGPDGSPRIRACEDPRLEPQPDPQLLESCCRARATVRPI